MNISINSIGKEVPLKVMYDSVICNDMDLVSLVVDDSVKNLICHNNSLKELKITDKLENIICDKNLIDVNKYPKLFINYNKPNLIEAKNWFLNIIDSCLFEPNINYNGIQYNVWYQIIDGKNKIMLEQNTKNEIFYVKYKHIWSVFEYKYILNYKQIQYFTHILLEEHLKCKVSSTVHDVYFIDEVLEEHLKYKVYNIIFRKI